MYLILKGPDNIQLAVVYCSPSSTSICLSTVNSIPIQVQLILIQKAVGTMKHACGHHLSQHTRLCFNSFDLDGDLHLYASCCSNIL